MNKYCVLRFRDFVKFLGHKIMPSFVCTESNVVMTGTPGIDR